MNLLHKKHSETEARLIQELKNDSAAAFDAIYDMYFRRLYAYCFQFSKSHKDAEDMVQEIFMKLWTARHSIIARDSIHSLIYRIARNSLISAYRANINSPQYEEYLNYRDSIAIEDHLPMEYDEFVSKIESCINTLPPAQQKIIRMSRFQMMDSSDIAAHLGIGEQTVRNQLSAALKSLKKKMGIFFILFC